MRHAQEVPVDDAHVVERATVARPGLQRTLMAIATVLLGAAFIAVVSVAVVDSASNGAAQLLLGLLPARHVIGVSTILAFVTITYMLCTISAPSGWLAPVVIGRVLAFCAALISMLWGLLTTSWLVVPLLVDGCESVYVAEERSFLYISSITVFERDGLLMTPVAQMSADDGHQPFAAGDYRARRTADGLVKGWFALEPGSNARVDRFELTIRPPSDCSPQD